MLTGYCRRMVYADGSAVMYGNPHREDFVSQEYPDGGPSEYIYFYENETNKFIVIFALVPCPAQADEGSNHISGDFWQVVREKIKNDMNGIKVSGICMAAGELSPHRVMKSEGKDSIDESGTESAKRIGNIIADNIIYCKDKTFKKYKKDDLTLEILSESISFPYRKASIDEIKRSDNYFNDNKNGVDRSAEKIDDVCLFTYIKNRSFSKDEYYQAPAFCIKLADILIFTAPCELFCEYAKRIAMRFPDNPILDIQLANDCIGYLPTGKAIENGGYSTYLFSALTDQTGGDLFVNKTIENFNKLL